MSSATRTTRTTTTKTHRAADLATFDRLRGRIEAALDESLPRTSALSQRLVEAMRYAAQSGGKRLRPLLTCTVCESLTGDAGPALIPACAVELVHTYSLVHDDLPAMDDDTLRRGVPTCHVAFDEATAILAGDALQALAFELLVQAPALDAETRLAMINALSSAAGWNGMVGGQALDIANTGVRIDRETLERMHRGKTAALIRAAVQIGALAGGATHHQYEALDRFGTRIGLAFQVVDDLLDVTQTTAVLGKTAGADAACGKTTFASLLGLERTREVAEHLLEEALAELAKAGIAGPLAALAEEVVRRSR